MQNVDNNSLGDIFTYGNDFNKALGIQHHNLSFLRMSYVNLVVTGIVFNIRASSSHIGLMMAFSEHWRWMIIAVCLIEDQSWIYCIDITSRWDTFVLFHLYGNKGMSLPLWPIRPRWFHTFCPCAEPLGDGHEGMCAWFGSQGSIALNWHSCYSGMRYSGTWLYHTVKWYWIQLQFKTSRPCVYVAYTLEALVEHFSTLDAIEHLTWVLSKFKKKRMWFIIIKCSFGHICMRICWSHGHETNRKYIDLIGCWANCVMCDLNLWPHPWH